MWKNSKNKSFRGKGKKYSRAEKASYYAGLKAGARMASKPRSKRRF